MKIPLHTNTAVVFRLSAMGDVALMSGVLSYWNSLYRTKFIVITREEFAPLFENHPAIAGIEALSKESLEYKTYSQTCKNLLKNTQIFLYSTCTPQPAPACLPTSGKQAFTATIKCPYCAVFFFGLKAKSAKMPCLRKMSANAMQASYAKTPLRPVCSNPKFTLMKTNERMPEICLLNFFRTNTKKIVAIHPFATHKAKTLPLGHWQKISAVLSGEYQILFVGKGDLPENMYGKNLINKTNLRELCAVLSRCSLLITGDSGPMHLADAVDTPLLALFGPTTKEWGFFPVGENAHILQKEMPCRPCSLHGKQKCRQKESCLEKISTEEIIAHAKKILS